MRSSHNKKSKRQFIKFRDYVRKSIKYTLTDFSTSQDPELNEIAKHIRVQIIKWNPMRKNALVCVYDPLKISNLSFDELRGYHGDASLKWINYAYNPYWELFELVNNFVQSRRGKLFKKGLSEI